MINLIIILPILIPYLIVGFIIGAFAQDDSTLEKLGPIGWLITLFIIVAWPLFFLLIWLFGEDGFLEICSKKNKL
jgi:hypothetical protein